jgi:hypothetical protein
LDFLRGKGKEERKEENEREKKEKANNKQTNYFKREETQSVPFF